RPNAYCHWELRYVSSLSKIPRPLVIEAAAFPTNSSIHDTSCLKTLLRPSDPVVKFGRVDLSIQDAIVKEQVLEERPCLVDWNPLVYLRRSCPHILSKKEVLQAFTVKT